MSRLYTALAGVVLGSAATFGITKLAAAMRVGALSGGDAQPSLPPGESGENDPDAEDSEPGSDANEVPEVPTIAVELPAFSPTLDLEAAVLETLQSQAQSDASESALPPPLDQYREEYGPKVVWWADVAFHTHFDFLPWGRFDTSKESHEKWVNAYLDALRAQAEMAGATDNLRDALTSSPFYGMGANASEEQLKRLDADYEPPPEDGEDNDVPNDDAPNDEPDEEPDDDPPPAPVPKGPGNLAELMAHMAEVWG